ncbi:CD36 family protein [Megaselia abdita]
MVHWSLVSVIFGFILVIAASFLGWYMFPKMILKKVTESVTILEGSDQYQRFVNLPQPIQFNVYIFNLSNPVQVQQGDLPLVKEIGPYVYKQYRRKKVKKFLNGGSSVAYSQETRFIFDKESSLPFGENDKITILSIHMNAFLQIFERDVEDIFLNLHSKFNNTINKNPGIRLVRRLVDRLRGNRKSVLQLSEGNPALSLLMTHLNHNLDMIFDNPSSMFLYTSVKNFLFDGVKFCINPSGLAKVICNQIKDKGSKTIKTLQDGSLAFSLFNHKNGSSEDIYEIHTGKGDISKLAKIQKIDDMSSLQIWLNNTEENLSICNMINGTDGSSYPPFLQHRSPLYIYSNDICRSIEMIYEKDVKYEGISALRYRIGDNFVNNIGPEFQNDCFCSSKLLNIMKRKNGCLYPGALDLTLCLGSPIIITLPHMLGASVEYSRLIKGLNPDHKKHRTFVDIQEVSGIPLNGKKKIQFNMFLKNISSIKLTENLTSILMPVLWIEEGVSLNIENVIMMKSKLINVLFTLKIIHWGAFIVGCIIVMLSIINYTILNKKSSPVDRIG